MHTLVVRTKTFGYCYNLGMPETTRLQVEVLAESELPSNSKCGASKVGGIEKKKTTIIGTKRKCYGKCCIKQKLELS